MVTLKNSQESEEVCRKLYGIVLITKGISVQLKVEVGSCPQDKLNIPASVSHRLTARQPSLL